ncbi:MAG TPA: DMT family transporter, partial [Azospira sp.]|nr:DMT family transporter [Azospira sp.]
MAASAKRLVGALWIALSATGFGAMAIFAKQAYADGVRLETLLFLRFALAGGLMAIFLGLRQHTWPDRQLLPGLIAMGAIGYVGQSYCYFAALHYASAGLTALLLYLYPVLVTLLAALLGRQVLTLKKMLAVSVAFAGTLLTIGSSLAGSSLGIALGLGAALIYSVYILAGERLTARAGALPAATVIMLSAAVVYGLLAMGSGIHFPVSARGWGAVLGIVLFSTVLGMVG